MTIAPYAARGLAFVLVWTELHDDTSPAEECATAAEARARVALARGELLRAFHEAGSREVSPKWVQRHLYASPPKQGVIAASYAAPLRAAIYAHQGKADSTTDLALAGEALLAPDPLPWRALQARRPALRDAVERLLALEDPPDSAAALAACVWIRNAALPMYITSGDNERVLAVNAWVGEVVGLHPTALIGAPIRKLLDACAAISAEPAGAFWERQSQVLQAGVSFGAAEFTCAFDLRLRPGSGPEGSQRFGRVGRIHANASEILDDRGVRQGWLVVWHLYAPDGRPL